MFIFIKKKVNVIKLLFILQSNKQHIILSKNFLYFFIQKKISLNILFIQQKFNIIFKCISIIFVIYIQIFVIIQNYYIDIIFF